MRLKPWRSSQYIYFSKQNHLHSPIKCCQITLVPDNPVFFPVPSFIYASFALLLWFMGATVQVFTVKTPYFNSFNLCVQLAGWRPCSTAAFSAGKPNASHPIGFITCQQKEKPQCYATFWNGSSNTQRPPNNEWCLAFQHLLCLNWTSSKPANYGQLCFKRWLWSALVFYNEMLEGI